MKRSMECRFTRDTVNIRYAWKVYFYKHTKTYNSYEEKKQKSNNSEDTMKTN